jgi:hypothetical protein
MIKLESKSILFGHLRPSLQKTGIRLLERNIQDLQERIRIFWERVSEWKYSRKFKSISHQVLGHRVPRSKSKKSRGGVNNNKNKIDRLKVNTMFGA